jgi:hypothetical protein
VRGEGAPWACLYGAAGRAERLRSVGTVDGQWCTALHASVDECLESWSLVVVGRAFPTNDVSLAFALALWRERQGGAWNPLQIHPSWGKHSAALPAVAPRLWSLPRYLRRLRATDNMATAPKKGAKQIFKTTDPYTETRWYAGPSLP